MKLGKTPAAFLLAAIFVAGLSACGEKPAENTEGPAERVGRQIGQAAAHAGEDLNKFAGKAGQVMEQAGKKLQNEAAQKNDKTE